MISRLDTPAPTQFRALADPGCWRAVALGVLLSAGLPLRAADQSPGAPVGTTAPAPAKAPPAPLEPGKEPLREGVPATAGGEDLRSLLGVNPVGLKRVDIPRMPALALRGYVEPRGQVPQALLEIAELNRVFLIQVGTEIPITIPGRLSPVGHTELTGLNDAAKPAADAARQGEGQSQIILKVLKITSQGVTVEAGLLGQTIIIR